MLEHRYNNNFSVINLLALGIFVPGNYLDIFFSDSLLEKQDGGKNGILSINELLCSLLRSLCFISKTAREHCIVHRQDYYNAETLVMGSTAVLFSRTNTIIC